MLKVENLTFYYNKYRIFNVEKTQILKNVTFEIKSGEIVGLIGQSGSGKSTLAKIISRLIKVKKDSRIYLQNRHINDYHQKEFYKITQILLQDSLNSLNPRLNILQNLLEPLVYLLDSKNIPKNITLIEYILEKVELERDILYKYPNMISGGQTQRICIAKCLLTNAKLILLDEVTSNLDYITQMQIMQFFINLIRKNEISILFITHDLELAKNFCDRILTLKEGMLE